MSGIKAFIAEYYIKHCCQDISSLKTIIVHQLCYNTQYGIEHYFTMKQVVLQEQYEKEHRNPEKPLSLT